MKIKTIVGVPTGFLLMAAFWAGLPLAWWDGLFPVFAYPVAIAFGAVSAMFVYGVVLNEKALKEAKRQWKDTRAVNNEGDSGRSMVLGYFKWIAFFAIINIVFTILRHAEL